VHRVVDNVVALFLEQLLRYSRYKAD